MKTTVQQLAQTGHTTRARAGAPVETADVVAVGRIGESECERMLMATDRGAT